jgi:hypothetical protein
MKLSNINPQHGDKVMGCNDTEYVGVENEIRFSRIYDLFINCIKLEIDPIHIWNGLSSSIKMDMNYGNWSYIK